MTTKRHTSRPSSSQKDADKDEIGHVSVTADAFEEDVDFSPVELQPERKQQYAVALDALRRLIASSAYNNWQDETTWILKIAEAAVLSAQEMEESSFPDIDDALASILRTILGGNEREMTSAQRSALEIMHAVASCGFHDNATGLTERVLDNDYAYDEEKEGEAERAKLWSDALALLRGTGDLSQKQAIVLQELCSFVNQSEHHTDKWIATEVMGLLDNMPELGRSDETISGDTVAEAAVAAMRRILRNRQRYQDWHALNELLRSFRINSQAASPEVFGRWTPERRRGYQHPIAKVWQNVKKGRYGHPPFGVPDARK